MSALNALVSDAAVVRDSEPAVVLRILFERHAEVVVVDDDGQPCGVATMADLMIDGSFPAPCWHPSMQDRIRPLDGLAVRDVMRSSIATIPVDATTARAAAALLRSGADELVLVGPSRRILGVVARNAICAR